MVDSDTVSRNPASHPEAKLAEDMRYLLAFLLTNKNNCLDFAESSGWDGLDRLAMVEEVRIRGGE